MGAVKYSGHDAAFNALQELNDSNDAKYAIARIPYTTSKGETGLHWINVNGQHQKDGNGVDWILVGRTSEHDGREGSVNDPVNWKWSYVKKRYKIK